MQWAKAECSLPRSMPTSIRNAVFVLSRPAPDKTAVATGCADVSSMDPLAAHPPHAGFPALAQYLTGAPAETPAGTAP